MDIVARTVSEYDSDKYYKSFKTYDHLVTILYATLVGISSLQELSTVLLACEGRVGHLNLKGFPKRSTLSDANKRRGSEVFANIYYGLCKRHRSFLSASSPLSPSVRHLKIVDSTTITFFSDILKGAGRNPINGKSKGIIKMHTMINARRTCLPCPTHKSCHPQPRLATKKWALRYELCR